MLTTRSLALVAAALATPLVATASAIAARPAKEALMRAGSPGVVVSRAVSPAKPMTASERFRMVSVAKSVVATVVLRLVGEARIFLEDTLERWLPRLVPRGASITGYEADVDMAEGAIAATVRGVLRF